jgi:hypothetical protein
MGTLSPVFKVPKMAPIEACKFCNSEIMVGVRRLNFFSTLMSIEN